MIELVDQPEVCVHCNKKFRMAKTLISHMCEMKRRYIQRNEKRVQTGMHSFNRFYQITQNSKNNKTYEEFCQSSFYNAFVKFGSFVNNTNPLYPFQFIDHVILSGIKLDHWCKDEIYTQYLSSIIKKEPIETAIQRTILTMMEWADDAKCDYTQYFTSVNLNRAVHDMTNGNISPWVMLNTTSGKRMIGNLNDEQLTLVTPTLDLSFWKKKFKENPNDVALVKEVCKESGIK